MKSFLQKSENVTPMTIFSLPFILLGALAFLTSSRMTLLFFSISSHGVLIPHLYNYFSIFRMLKKVDEVILFLCSNFSASEEFSVLP